MLTSMMMDDDQFTIAAPEMKSMVLKVSFYYDGIN